MWIGIPKEIKDKEFRVGATPNVVKGLVSAGHCVVVETRAGEAIGFFDDNYLAVGASIEKDPQKVYEADLIVKVKEPLENEIAWLHEGQLIFCYLHLASNPMGTKGLLEKKVIAIAYEQVRDQHGGLPLLIPMSEIAGKLSIQVGANALQISNGGRGILLGGVPGVVPGKVLIIGGGVVGMNAARIAMGFGSDVSIVDNNLGRLQELDSLYGPCLKTQFATPMHIERLIAEADLVVGAVLTPGKRAPHLITKAMVSKMLKGAVIVDVAIDQGGCCETSRPTTHSNPTYILDGVVHYCVTNMPGACARTSTIALMNATSSYILKLASKGYKGALEEDSGFADGLCLFKGVVTSKAVANDLEYEYVPAEKVLHS
jgi:alanine dehydrogenase